LRVFLKVLAAEPLIAVWLAAMLVLIGAAVGGAPHGKPYVSPCQGVAMSVEFRLWSM